MNKLTRENKKEILRLQNELKNNKTDEVKFEAVYYLINKVLPKDMAETFRYNMFSKINGVIVFDSLLEKFERIRVAF